MVRTAALIMCMAVWTPAPAQTPATAASQPVELASEAVRIESVGLRFYPPAGAVVDTSRMGEQVSVQISPGGEALWLITVQTPRTRDTNLTALGVAEAALDQLVRSAGVVDRRVGPDGHVREQVVESKAQVLEPAQEVRIAAEAPAQSRPAARFYVRLPAPGDGPAIIRGYTVFRVVPGQFAAFDLTTTEPAFAQSRRVYETVVGTARFGDGAAEGVERATAVETGVAFLARLTEAEYDAAVSMLTDQWYRLCQRTPGASDADATEVAYRRVRAWKGMRGEIDTARTRDRYRAADRQEGYLVRVDARYLQDGRVIDTVGIYFMTPDRREEAWSLQMAIRERGSARAAVWNEAGARTGPQMSVATWGDGAESRTVQPVVPKHGYLNQFEAFVLPQLLIQAKAHGEFGFYVYQSDSGSIRLRRDTLREAADRPGVWTLTTRTSEDRDPQVSIYTGQGMLIETTLPPNAPGTVAVWTPITLERLADLWRRKGLPMD